MSNPVLDAAMGYLAMGWRTFPLSPGSKQPYPGTRGFLDASNDWTTVARWFDAPRDPDGVTGWGVAGSPNIALATGSGSGVFVLDVDMKHDGYQSLDKMVKRIGEGFLTTRTHATVNGGVHLFYRWPTTLHIGRKINAFKRLDMPGIDLLGNDGYAVLPPSNVIREDGRWGVYAVVDDLPVPEAPTELLTLIQDAAQPISGPRDFGGIAPPAKHGTAGVVSWLAGVKPGEQDDACSWVVRALKDEGCSATEAANLLWSAMVQMEQGGRPWTDNDVRRHVRSAYR